MLSHGAMDFSNFIKKEAEAEIVETEEVVEEPVEEVAAEQAAEAAPVEKTAAPEVAQPGQNDLMKIASMAILENAPEGGLEALSELMSKVAKDSAGTSAAGQKAKAARSGSNQVLQRALTGAVIGGVGGAGLGSLYAGKNRGKRLDAIRKERGDYQNQVARDLGRHYGGPGILPNPFKRPSRKASDRRRMALYGGLAGAGLGAVAGIASGRTKTASETDEYAKFRTKRLLDQAQHSGAMGALRSGAGGALLGGLGGAALGYGMAGQNRKERLRGLRAYRAGGRRGGMPFVPNRNSSNRRNMAIAGGILGALAGGAAGAEHGAIKGHQRGLERGVRKLLDEQRPHKAGGVSKTANASMAADYMGPDAGDHVDQIRGERKAYKNVGATLGRNISDLKRGFAEDFGNKKPENRIQSYLRNRKAAKQGKRIGARAHDAMQVATHSGRALKTLSSSLKDVYGG
jgi:hypothetical protein